MMTPDSHAAFRSVSGIHCRFHGFLRGRITVLVKIKARVEHRLGEVLAQTVKRGGDRKSNHHSDGLIPAELGSEIQRHNTSQRTQKLAAIPWAKIEESMTRRPPTTRKRLRLESSESYCVGSGASMVLLANKLVCMCKQAARCNRIRRVDGVVE
jgi:hypothetical protein